MYEQGPDGSRIINDRNLRPDSRGIEMPGLRIGDRAQNQNPFGMMSGLSDLFRQLLEGRGGGFRHRRGRGFGDDDDDRDFGGEARARAGQIRQQVLARIAQQRQSMLGNIGQQRPGQNGMNQPRPIADPSAASAGTPPKKPESMRTPNPGLRLAQQLGSATPGRQDRTDSPPPGALPSKGLVRLPQITKKGSGDQADSDRQYL